MGCLLDHIVGPESLRVLFLKIKHHKAKIKAAFLQAGGYTRPIRDSSELLGEFAPFLGPPLLRT